MAKKPEGDKFNVEIADGARLGEYTNFVKIQHSGIDFRFDFAKIIPEENMLHVHTRLFMSPVHAKLFFKALEENILRYETNFGPIELKHDKDMPMTGMPSTEKH